MKKDPFWLFVYKIQHVALWSLWVIFVEKKHMLVGKKISLFP